MNTDILSVGILLRGIDNEKRTDNKKYYDRFDNESEEMTRKDC